MKPLRSRRSRELKNGYTTGTCAAAASQAALQILLDGSAALAVAVELPRGGSLTVPVQNARRENSLGIAEVIKDGGDDWDITHGMTVRAEVQLDESGRIFIAGGAGIGRVTKPGLALPVGEAAINPVPREMISCGLGKMLPAGRGATVTISIPGGEEAARRTLNPRLGIIGGLSILGTTGIVRPMSDEAYVDSLVPQIDQALAMGHRTLVLTPGGMGARMAGEMGIPEDAVIQTSNFVGQMLDECAARSVGRILMLGHIGKIIKVAGGIFNTHSRIADARREILAAHAALQGAEQEMIREIMELNTMDASVPLLTAYGLTAVYGAIAAAVSCRCRERMEGRAQVGTIIYALDGRILGHDDMAGTIGGGADWQLKL